MDLDLAIMIVWLFLGLGIGILGLLMTLTLANTLSAIKPTTQTQRPLRPSPSRTLWSKWLQRLRPSRSPPSSSPSQTDPQQDLSSPLLAPHLPPLACDLQIRSVTISPSCCLLQTKKGRPLHGGAVATRLTRLQRMKILI